MNARSALPVPLLRRIGFALAMAGLVMSALVHIASFFGLAFRVEWFLHVGAMAGMGALIVMTIGRAPLWPLSARWRAIWRDAPTWGERVYQVFLLYFLAHFGALLFITRRLMRDEPASLPQAMRMFSAGWMVVFVLCALAWWPFDRAYLDPEGSRPPA